METRKRRISPRKSVDPIRVSHMTSLNDFTKIARNCEIIEASSTGLLLQVDRNQLIPAQLKKNLSIDSLKGNKVFIRLEDMNLEISGLVARTQLLGKKGYLIAIDYTDDSPEYWRECLMDLLPSPGEFD